MRCHTYTVCRYPPVVTSRDQRSVRVKQHFHPAALISMCATASILPLLLKSIWQLRTRFIALAEMSLNDAQFTFSQHGWSNSSERNNLAGEVN
jgi:hypothetical protein